MLNSIFAMLRRAMAVPARLMDSNVDIKEKRSLENQVKVLQREKQDLLDTLDIKLMEIRNLETSIGGHKSMLESTTKKFEDVHNEYSAKF